MRSQLTQKAQLLTTVFSKKLCGTVLIGVGQIIDLWRVLGKMAEKNTVSGSVANVVSEIAHDQWQIPGPVGVPVDIKESKIVVDDHV